jgi:putative transcriptional regulator
MAIIVKLDDVLHARRMTLTELSVRIDITMANLSILKTGKARAIRFSTLEAICTALRCQPGDLLEYTSAEETGAPTSGDHVVESDLDTTPTMGPRHD